MNLSQLVKRLQREAKASPGKAAVLAAMLLAALYFWAPLASRLLGGAPAAKKRNLAASANVVAAATAAPGDNTTPFTDDDPLRWDRIRAALVRDARMQSAAFSDQWVNPFAVDPPPTEPEPPRPPEVATKQPPARPPADPRDAGLVLTSVLVSSSQRRALINGRVLRENETLEIENRSGSGLLTYRITQIHPQGVELEIAGHKQQLELPRTNWQRK